jgi:benzodiazapine receptor
MPVKIVVLTKLVVCFGLTFAAPLIGSLFTTSEAISDWYAGLNRPFFTPPGWIFGPVWTILYALMALSAFIIWQEGLSSTAVKIALALYLVQLALNALWTPLFFGLQMPLVAFVEILLLWLAILGTIWAFGKLSVPAAVLLMPYFLWTTFAAVLNGSIWLLNR